MKLYERQASDSWSLNMWIAFGWAEGGRGETSGSLVETKSFIKLFLCLERPSESKSIKAHKQLRQWVERILLHSQSHTRFFSENVFRRTAVLKLLNSPISSEAVESVERPPQTTRVTLKRFRVRSPSRKSRKRLWSFHRATNVNFHPIRIFWSQ